MDYERFAIHSAQGRRRKGIIFPFIVDIRFGVDTFAKI
jgi:hypothetical protein